MSAHRILVTGANGFVGKWLVEILGQKLSAPSVELLPVSGPGGPGRQVDLTDVSALYELVAGFTPTCVVHLAAISALGDAARDVNLAWETNFSATRALASAILRHAPTASLIFAGSSEEYGRSFLRYDGPIVEDAPLEPLSVYGATKAAADIALGQMAEAGLRVARLRLFNHTGPGQEPRFAIASFARQIAAIEAGTRPPVIRVGNLSARREFLDVRDVVELYAQCALLLPPEGVGVFNVTSGDPISLQSVLEMLLSMSPVRIETQVDEALVRPIEVPVTRGSTRKTYDTLGWSRRISFEQTLADVLGYWRQQNPLPSQS